jgi:hypothetical protein
MQATLHSLRSLHKAFLSRDWACLPIPLALECGRSKTRGAIGELGIREGSQSRCLRSTPLVFVSCASALQGVVRPSTAKGAAWVVRGAAKACWQPTCASWATIVEHCRLLDTPVTLGTEAIAEGLLLGHGRNNFWLILISSPQPWSCKLRWHRDLHHKSAPCVVDYRSFP